MAKPKGDFFQKDIPEYAGGNVGGIGNLATDPKTRFLPDKGPAYFEYRIYIKDHGRINDTETGREPKWVDFTEIDGIYRLKKLNGVINVGSETSKPYVFKASSIVMPMDNSDFIFDNLKKANLLTVDGLEAKFLSTPEGTNYDLTAREVKITGRSPQAEMSTEKDSCHYYVRGIETNANGTAKISLDSLEKSFIDTQANKVKDGRNWYFGRSVKFLANELIKSVRRKYLGINEELPDDDEVAIANIEDIDGERLFSEYDRPIAEILSTDNSIAGEKRFIVTAATKRNIFRSKIMSEVAIGANIIRLRIDVATGKTFIIRKGDVLTIGKASGASFDDLSEEKVTVLEDVTFTPDLGNQNVRVTSLTKSHTTAHVVERWIMYLGVTRTAEETTEQGDEVFILAFDPDRDESVNLITLGNSGVIGEEILKHPIRYIGVKSTPSEYGVPDMTDKYLYAVGCTHTFPGKPNENGIIYAYEIDPYAEWNDSETHLALLSSSLLNDDNGGLYTGEFNFRTLQPILDTTYIDVDGSETLATSLFGAFGIGQFVPESKFLSSMIFDNRNYANEMYKGFGYFTGLMQDISSIDTEIVVYSPAYDSDNIMGIHGNTNITGSIYVIGLSDSVNDNNDTNKQEVRDENFRSFLTVRSSVIRYGYRDDLAVATEYPKRWRMKYKLDTALESDFSKEKSIVIIIPQTGKMYLRNLGENVMIPKPQRATFAAYDSNDSAIENIDSNVFHNTIRIEKKQGIDTKKTISPSEKKLIDTSNIEEGYHSSITQKHKLTIDSTDTLSVDLTTPSNIRVVPAQYISQPFNPENFSFHMPLYGVDEDGDSFIRDSTLFNYENNTVNKPPVYLSRNMHSWIFPVIGVYVKYEKENASNLSFDTSKIADNGNSELLGYWYLYNAAGSTRGTPGTSATEMSTPLMDLAIADDKGRVITPLLSDDFNTLYANDHVPLCTILHNVNDVSPTGQHSGNSTSFGNWATIKSKFILVVGGSFITDYYEWHGASYSFERWEPGNADFFSTFPLTVDSTLDLQWRFKKITDASAKGTLFVSPTCTPVRPYHPHYPNTSQKSSFSNTLTVDSTQISEDINGSIIGISTEEVNSILYAQIEISSTDYANILAGGDFVGYPLNLTVTVADNDKLNGNIGSFRIVSITPAASGNGVIKVENFITEMSLLLISPNSGTFRIAYQESYSAYNIDDNFEDGSEEQYNFIAQNHTPWAIDRFSQNDIMGVVHGKGANRLAGGYLKGLSITDADSNTSKVTIPFGHYCGDNNLLIFTIATESLQTISSIDVNINRDNSNTILRYDKTAYEFQNDDIANIVINGSNEGRWNIIEAQSPYTPGLLYINNNNTDWQSFSSASIQRVHPIQTGDRFYIDGYGTSGYLVVMGIVSDTSIVCRWVPIVASSSSSLLPTSGSLKKDSTANPNVSATISYIGLSGDNLNLADLSQLACPMPLPVHKKHLDLLPTSAVGLESKFEFMSMYRITMNARPVFEGSVSFPKSLYGKALHKFWYYNERKTSPYNKDYDLKSRFISTYDIEYIEDDPPAIYIAGDQSFDSEIKPTAVGAGFYSSIGKWYLSRRDDIRSGNRYINANTYTPNYNIAAIGQDDNLYAIVNVNYYNTLLTRKYPFIKFCTNFQKNIRQCSDFPYPVLLSRRSFAFTTDNRLYINSELSKVDVISGAVQVTSQNIYPDDMSETETDWEIHGIFDFVKSTSNYSVGLVNWINQGFVEFNTRTTSTPLSKPYYLELSKHQVIIKSGPSTFNNYDWEDYGSTGKFIEAADEFGNKAYLYLIKSWTDIHEDYDYSGAITQKALRGVIQKRHDILSTTQADREEREFVCIFSTRIGGEITMYFRAATGIYTAFSYTSIRHFTFRIDAAARDGYFFADTSDNNIKRWDGDPTSTIATDDNLGNALPCAEGDFNQYDLMLKIDSPYEEIFGFSSGPRIFLAAANPKGGRNIIWKLSKSLATHIVVADFENLSVWQVLSQFSEITDSVLSFDRFGNLHMKTRPNVDADSPEVFTFDKMELGNVLSIEKKPAFERIYNHIEAIPSKPILPTPKVDLTTISDLNVISANNNTFIKDSRIDIEQKDRNKKRPNIFAYQKDYERKKIFLICNNGQFDATGTEEERGAYSRFKYSITNDIIELRLTVEAQAADSHIIVNRIPYDNVNSELAIRPGNIIFIGNEGPWYVDSEVDDPNVPRLNIPEKKIYLTDTLQSIITINKKIQPGMPVVISNSAEFNADGGGNFDESLTYSPKSFFTEIGEWTFDEAQLRPTLTLNRDLLTSQLFISVDDASLLSDSGIVSIDGELLSYSNKQGNTLILSSYPLSDHALGSNVYIMPPSSLLAGAWRLGGYDEIGPSCLNEYHLYDPNEDEVPYYNAGPTVGGKPITALEFYWSGQKVITYTDDITSMTNVGYRTRHRTFAEMKIAFNGFRFTDGDKIDIDFPGLKLEPQVHLKKVYSNYDSIQRSGLRQYPASANRFFNNTTALVAAKRILSRLSNIGAKVIIKAEVKDIYALDFANIVKIIDRDMFTGKTDAQVKGYVSSIKFNDAQNIATISCLIEPL